MSEVILEKRYALAAALVFQQRTGAFDDAGEMFIRLVHRAKARAVPAELSPYQTAHINRFGNYSMNFGRDPQPVHIDFRKPPQSESAVAKVLPFPIAKADLA